MKSSKLKKYLETTKKETVVLGAVERHLLSLPRDESRSSTVLHPSEIVKDDWCIRASWFLLNGHEPNYDPPGLRLATIFAEGHAIHEKWQRWLADAGLLVGAEIPVYHDELQIAGSADGIVESNGERFLLEIKSIGTGTIRFGGGYLDPKGLAASFKQINAPYRDHVRQASLYVYCLRWMHEQGIYLHEPPNKILFLYECKEDQNAREFIVEYDESVIAPVITNIETLLSFESEPPPCPNGGCKSCAGMS